MTNPEKAVSEQQTSNGATPANEITTYAEIFCQAMTRLNTVAFEQTEGLLNIAIQAAEKYHSINASAEANKAELDEFINQMKTTAADISQINQQTPETPAAPQPSPELVLQAVIQALSNAIHNSANNQQQLNVTGQAILTLAASLLLSSDGKQQ